jgi:hypothetical protein
MFSRMTHRVGQRGRSPAVWPKFRKKRVRRSRHRERKARIAVYIYDVSGLTVDVVLLSWHTVFIR